MKLEIILLSLCIIILLSGCSQQEPYQIDGNKVWMENSSYGKIEVTPHTCTDIPCCQYANLTSYLNTQNLDVAFRFEDPIKGKIWRLNNGNWIDVTSYIEHLNYQDKDYYIAENINFVKDTKYAYKWCFEPKIGTTGKWDLLLKRSSDTVQEAQESGNFIILDPWWNTSYSLRKQINISNVLDTLTNYSIKLNVTYDSNMQNDFDDLRFTNATNGTLPYWIEQKSNGVEAIVWVKADVINSNTNTTIYMYYNNSASTSAADIKQAFEFGDDFDDSSLDTNLWKNFTSDGVTTESNGYLKLYATDTAGYGEVMSKINFTVNYSATAHLNFSNTSANYDRIGFATMNAHPSQNSDNYHEFFEYHASQWILRNGNLTGTYDNTRDNPGHTIFKLEIVRNSTNSSMMSNSSSPYYTNQQKYYTGELPFIISGQRSGGVAMVVNYTYVRPWRYPEPVVSFGSEEAGGFTIDLVYPTDDSFYNTTLINFNCSALDSSETKNITLFIDGALNYTKLGTGTAFLELYKSYTMPGTNHTWTCKARNADNVEATTTTNDFEIDLTPPTLNIITPTGTISKLAYNTYNQSLNFTASDKNLDICWYQYNSTNKTISCSSNSSFIIDNNQTDFIFFVNDSANHEVSQLVNFNYTIFEYSQSYTATAYETAFENFTINFKQDQGLWGITEAKLIYNNTEYAGTINSSTNNAYFLKQLQIPSNNSLSTYGFYWQFEMTNGTGTFKYNSTEKTQTVNTINLIECDTTTYNVTALNFTTKEEGSFAITKTSLEANFNYWGGGDGSIHSTYNFANLTENNSNFQFCIDPAFASFQVDAIISYYATGYDRREYFLSNYTINNVSNNINLYLASTATTDVFTFTVIDQNEDPVSGAEIRVQRWDIGTNNFYTVGIIHTSSAGTGLINLRLNDAWYRYQVLYDDQLYLTTEPVKESTTSRTLKINLAQQNPFEQFLSISHELTFNKNTNVTVFTYADASGATATGCLKVLKLMANTSAIDYNSCVQTTSGTLSTTIVGNGTYAIQGILKLNSNNSNVEQVVDELIVTLGKAERFVTIQTYGQFISLLIIGTMATIGVAVGSIILGCCLIIGALIGLNLLGWLNVTATVIYALGSIMILIIVIASKKRGE